MATVIHYCNSFVYYYCPAFCPSGMSCAASMRPFGQQTPSTCWIVCRYSKTCVHWALRIAATSRTHHSTRQRRCMRWSSMLDDLKMPSSRPTSTLLRRSHCFFQGCQPTGNRQTSFDPVLCQSFCDKGLQVAGVWSTPIRHPARVATCEGVRHGGLWSWERSAPWSSCPVGAESGLELVTSMFPCLVLLWLFLIFLAFLLPWIQVWLPVLPSRLELWNRQARKGIACHRMIVEGYLKGMPFDCENDCVVWLDALPNTWLAFATYFMSMYVFFWEQLYCTFFQKRTFCKFVGS